MKILLIELTNNCNENCWFCPHNTMVRKKGFMSLETARMAASKLKEMNQKMVILHGVGESLLHPEFSTIEAMFKDIHTSVTTNASCFTEEIVNKLINSHLDLVRVSMDFECNEDLVNKLIRERKINGKETLLNCKGTSREKVERLRKKWPGIEITYLGNWAGQMDNITNTVHSNICPFRDQNSGMLFWDGRITSCCMDYEANFVVGTIEEAEKLNYGKIDMCDDCDGLC